MNFLAQMAGAGDERTRSYTVGLSQTRSDGGRGQKTHDGRWEVKNNDYLYALFNNKTDDGTQQETAAA
jgi:hypothetical protein